MKISSAIIAFATCALSSNALKLPFLGDPTIAARYAPTLRRQTTPAKPADNATYDAMIGAYTSGTGQQAIQNDIANLTATSIAIDNAFSSVALNLAKIDALGFAKPFAPQWAVLQQQYINILWSSRTTAAQLSAYCQDFEGTILPISLGQFPGQPPFTTAQLIQILQGFQSDATTFEAQAQSTSNAFRTLANDLSAFTATFQNFAVSQKLQDQQQIDNLNIDIKALTDKIDTLNKQINAIAASVGVTIFATLAAVVIFPEFAPLIIGAGALAVAGEATAWGILAAQRTAAQKQLASDKIQIVQLEAELTQIASANATLNTIANTTIPDMQAKLGDFQAIWNAVTTDINQVIEYISLAQSSANSSFPVPFIVYAHLQNANSIYAPLGNALVSYSNGIASSGIPQPTTSVAASTGAVSAFTHVSQVYFSPTVAKVKQMIADYQAAQS